MRSEQGRWSADEDVYKRKLELREQILLGAQRKWTMLTESTGVFFFNDTAPTEIYTE